MGDIFAGRDVDKVAIAYPSDRRLESVIIRPMGQTRRSKGTVDRVVHLVAVAHLTTCLLRS